MTIDLTIHEDYDIRPLAAAVVIQAAREARGGKQDARRWLKGEGLFWLEVCGVDLEREQVTQWIRRGCPLPRSQLLYLGQR